MGAASQVQAQLQGKVLVVGLGKTGLSCARHLVAQGAEVAVVDSRDQPPALETLRQELPDVAIFTGGFEDRVFEFADHLVVSPGVSLREPALAHAIARGVPVLGDIELFARQARAPVIAITGSNGKSTVTSLVGELVRAAGFDVRVGGNLGTPALELLRQSEPDFYVLELSSFQLETTSSLKAVAAAVLNVSADHMDRYQSLDEYAAAKRRIYHGARTLVLNRDDPVVAAMADAGGDCVWFGLEAPASAARLRIAVSRRRLLAGTGRAATGAGIRRCACAAATTSPMPWPRWRLPRRPASTANRRCRYLREFPGLRASQSVGSGERRRYLVQRFQGHQRRRHPGGCFRDAGQGGVDRRG